jgi:1,4-dihydroxy-2-naphthoate polyprenyltransferase
VTDVAREPAERRAREITPPSAEAGRAAKWRWALTTGNPPPGRVDAVSRWLILTRASVFPMTLTAGIVGGLLAWWNDGDASWALWVVATLGIVLAHAANNLMNDLFDLEVGADSDDYPRALYAPHPVLSGMISRRGVLLAAGLVNVADLAILIGLFVARGWAVVAFALSGLFLSVAYTAPPLRLKKHGLGEPTVLVVWGPLMVGGVYYAAADSIGWNIVLASIPYALLCTAVLMGKHIDKAAWDAPAGTRTLPVLLGDRAARITTQAMMIAFYPLVVLLVVLGTVPIFTLVALVGLQRLVQSLRAYSQPKPAEPPPGFPIWPLWFAPIAFLHTRRAGGLFVLGMFAGVLIGF